MFQEFIDIKIIMIISIKEILYFQAGMVIVKIALGTILCVVEVR